MATRIFLMGVVTLFLGLQFRAVDTFVLNEKASRILDRGKAETVVEEEDVYAASLYDPYLDEPATQTASAAKKSIQPPRWLGWSFLSIAAVLILTCPCFRSE